MNALKLVARNDHAYGAIRTAEIKKSCHAKKITHREIQNVIVAGFIIFTCLRAGPSYDPPGAEIFSV